MAHFVSLNGPRNLTGGLHLGTDVFVGEATPIFDVDTNPVRISGHNDTESYFMMYVEHPPTFFVMRVQKHFLSSKKHTKTRCGIYEQYVSNQRKFYIPFQSQHRFFEYLQPIADPSKCFYLSKITLLINVFKNYSKTSNILFPINCLLNRSNLPPFLNEENNP